MNNIVFKKTDFTKEKVPEKISAEEIQRAFFNENLKDEKKEKYEHTKKTNSRERLAVHIIGESSGPDFQKIYNMFSRMTDDEFILIESVLRGTIKK